MADGLGTRLAKGFSPLVRANLAVVVSATLVTGLAGLVAEDLLPKDADSGALIVWQRWVALLVTIAALAFALRYRGSVHRTTGTLFQVQILDEQMADLRAASRRQAERDRMAVRSITRWIDYRHRHNPAGMIEMVDVCKDVANVLELQINTDPLETGYTIAPVMAWPMAVAIGTQLPLGDRLQLLELKDDDGNPTNLIPLDQRPRPIVVQPLELPETGEDGAVGVWIAVTRAAQSLRPHQWATLGVSAGYRITLGPELPTTPRLSDDDVSGLGAALAATLAQVRNDHPTRELVVVAMMTKAVAMATGWHLAQQPCRFFDKTYLMFWDADESRLVPMRVKDAQPCTGPGPVHA